MSLNNFRAARLSVRLLLAALLFAAVIPLRADNNDPLLGACANEDVGKAKVVIAL